MPSVRSRVTCVFGTLCALYATVTVVVAFLEALAIVRSRQAEDLELVNLCQDGVAKGSSKMRQACLEAYADLASPVIFKALVEAVSCSFAHICQIVGSPIRVALVAALALWAVVSQATPWARLFATTNRSADMVTPAQLQAMHFISFADADNDDRGADDNGSCRGGSSVVKASWLRKGATRVARISECDDIELH